MDGFFHTEGKFPTGRECGKVCGKVCGNNDVLSAASGIGYPSMDTPVGPLHSLYQFQAALGQAHKLDRNSPASGECSLDMYGK